MRVAIPVMDGRVERVFDSATTIMVIDLRDDGRADFFETALELRSMKNRASELAAMRVDVVLCDEISHALETLITAHGIEVKTKHSGRVDEAMKCLVDPKHRHSRSSDERWSQLTTIS